jgi:hypothetical protein
LSSSVELEVKNPDEFKKEFSAARIYSVTVCTTLLTGRVLATGCPCRKPYPAWQSIENRTMIACNEGSLQAHWLDGCGSDPVAGNA